MPEPNFPKRAFVTGATGFVGSNLVRVLLAGGTEVRAIVRDDSDRSGLAGLEIDLRTADLLDIAALESVIHGCDVCFHLAAAISGESAALYRTNVEGTRAVLTAAIRSGCSAIVHTGTMGTLSRQDGSPARENDHRLEPGASEYVKSKFEAETVARELARTGAPIRIVHPSAPVGRWDRVPTVSGKRIVEVLSGKLPRWIQGKINHIHVADVAMGMVLAAARGRPCESYLLANKEGNLTREEFVRLVSSAAGIPVPRMQRRRGFLSWLAPRPSPSTGGVTGPKSLACDPTWTISQLQFPQTPLDQAFHEAVEWFRNQLREDS